MCCPLHYKNNVGLERLELSIDALRGHCSGHCAINPIIANCVLAKNRTLLSSMSKKCSTSELRELYVDNDGYAPSSDVCKTSILLVN